MTSHDEHYMAQALELAAQAAAAGEVPVGALVVMDDRIVAARSNGKEGLQNPCAHAEILALQDAAQALGRWRLAGSTLYSTLEPCVMCAGACIQARVSRVVFGAWDSRFGGVESLYGILRDPRSNHRCEVTAGVLQGPSAKLLQDFFRERRRNKGGISDGL